MAGPDPRRSSRARTTQSQSQISSSASSVSGRLERNSRHFNKGGSPQKSTSADSLSSEPPEDTITAEDPFGTRRRTRGQAEERERGGAKPGTSDMANGDGDVQEEDEAVRCVCGNEEYQGPPPFDEDSKHGLKHGFDLDSFFSADVTDDTAGLFVQCDICKVWQHGGCVGIMTEESSPDEYFCEQCRQDLHKLWTASNGSVFSHYLPLTRHARATSRAASLNKDTAARSPTKEKESRSGRAAANNHSSKRRSTLNSREAGYDEAEALRRAIEASKEDAVLDPAENGNRRPKRGRSDSHEKPENIKRQKTSSRSTSPLSDKNADDSDDAGASGRNGTSKSKSRSGAVARNQRAEKISEKEERERQRLETANKRKGRAERRRADGMASSIHVRVTSAHAETDSDPSEEMPLAARAAAHNNKTVPAPGISSALSAAIETAARPSAAAAAEPPPTSHPAPDTPPTIAVQSRAAAAEKKRSHKKKGRNQYTRDRDRDAQDDENSPARSQSRDIQKDEHHHHHHNHHHNHGALPNSGGKAAPEGTTTATAAGGKSGGGSGSGSGNAKVRGGMSSKITMNDMKRRAAALLDFISRTQVELAGEAFTGPSSTATATTSANGSSNGTAADKTRNGGGAGSGGDEERDVLPVVLAVTAAGGEMNGDGRLQPEREFRDLGCLEMMDSLTRRLVKWQQQYTG